MLLFTLLRNAPHPSKDLILLLGMVLLVNLLIYRKNITSVIITKYLHYTFVEKITANSITTVHDKPLHLHPIKRHLEYSLYPYGNSDLFIE